MRADDLERLKGEFLRLSSGKLSGRQRSTTASDSRAVGVSGSSLVRVLHSRSDCVGCEVHASGDFGIMFMTSAIAIALAEARSYLAALADRATGVYESSQYERMLMELNGLHPFGPALSPTAGTKSELLGRLEAAVDRMLDLGERRRPQSRTSPDEREGPDLTLRGRLRLRHVYHLDPSALPGAERGPILGNPRDPTVTGPTLSDSPCR
jgi:hypothetical protein